MPVYKQEFLDWKNNSITKELEQEARESVIDLTIQFISRRESNPADDQYIKGFIKGVESIMDWVPDIIQTEEEEDAIED